MVFTPVRRIAMIYVVTGMTLEGKARFGNIAKLAKCLLSLSHSNADTE